jgi:hypothetical protein
VHTGGATRIEICFWDRAGWLRQPGARSWRNVAVVVTRCLGSALWSGTMNVLMRLTTELLDAAGGLAATAPDMYSGIAASATDQLDRLGPTLDTPAGGSSSSTSLSAPPRTFSLRSVPSCSDGTSPARRCCAPSSFVGARAAVSRGAAAVSPHAWRRRRRVRAASRGRRRCRPSLPAATA